MLLAVMSDSHDNIWNLEKALSIISKRQADIIIHCGDFVAPFVFKELAQTSIPVHGVLGNNDGDIYQLTRLTHTVFPNITLHGLTGEIALDDGLKVGFTHQEVVARGLACSGNYDLVCFGHSHKYSSNKLNKTILLNPGEIMGKEGSPGFCLVETGKLVIERVLIGV